MRWTCPTPARWQKTSRADRGPEAPLGGVRVRTKEEEDATKTIGHPVPATGGSPGDRPGYAGPLFYVGTDVNAEQEAWRGLIVGAVVIAIDHPIAAISGLEFKAKTGHAPIDV